MKEHGILFSGAMVRALLAGRKTMTRRAVKPQFPKDDPPLGVGTYHPTVVRRGIEGPGPEAFGAYGEEWTRRCPHPPGTRLWVRETSVDIGRGGIVYAANAPIGRPLLPSAHGMREGRWTPSLLMPRARARIFLDVVKVRVERAQDISGADVAAEGMDAEAVRALAAVATKKRRTEALSGAMVDAMRPAELWRAGWTLINGRASWDANPWCWVYEFRRVPDAR